MANQILNFLENGKCLLYKNDEGTFIALQDMDACDIAEEIADEVAGKTIALPTDAYADTGVSYDFGCNYEWYKLEWCIVNDNGQMRLITDDFILNVPGR